MKLLQIHVPLLALTLCALAVVGLGQGSRVQNLSAHACGLTPEQSEILSHMSIVFLDDGAGALQKTIRITGVNVQIVSGSGATNGYPIDPATTDDRLTTTNGLGNFIVGYNELRGLDDFRTGSHNLITGTNQDHSSFGGLVAGRASSISGPYGTAVGCGQIDPIGCGCDDLDGDGFFAQSGCGTLVDCDDFDADVFPGATEVCDGFDNNCDGISDEGFDADGDGVGTCLDCDDTDPTVYPEAPEICGDGIDNNCDTLVDDGCPCEDMDGDGFFAQFGCGTLVDCDDFDADVFPGATEVCDGFDNNCDGFSDEGFDADGDGIGACLDCDDTDPTVYPGAPEICGDGIDNNCDSFVDEGCP